MTLAAHAITLALACATVLALADGALRLAAALRFISPEIADE